MKNKLAPIFGLSAVLLSGYASAQDFHVSDSFGLRTALADAAVNREDNTIYLAPGTYKTTADFGGTFKYSELGGAQDLTIYGVDRDSVILDGDGFSDVLDIAGSSTDRVTLENITIQNGLRGVSFSGAIGIVKNSVVQNNTLAVYPNGAGIYASYRLILESTLVKGNHLIFGSSSRGAGVYSSRSLTMKDTEISGNQITGVGANYYGAGLYTLGYLESDSSVVMDNTITTSGEFADAQGGGIFAYEGVDLWNTVVSGNKIVLYSNQWAFNIPQVRTAI